MKKILYFVLIILVIIVTGCNKNNDIINNDDSPKIGDYVDYEKYVIDKDYPNMNRAEYGIYYSYRYFIGLKIMYRCDKFECMIDQTPYLGIRPVVELDSSIKYTKTINDGKTVWTIN